MKNLLYELKPGDRIEVEQEVTCGPRCLKTRTVGTVVRTERRRIETRQSADPQAEHFSEAILLELPDGELTSVTVDENTMLRRA
jgi:hypothetical protein